MGADFIGMFIDITDYPTMDEWKAEMLHRIDTRTSEQLQEASMAMTGGEATDDEVLTELRKAVEFLAHPHRRDVTIWLLGGRKCLVTGGLSWGDSPTDAFDLMEWIISAGID